MHDIKRRRLFYQVCEGCTASVLWCVKMDENGPVTFHNRFRKVAAILDSRK